MSLEKVKEYFKAYGIEDRIIELSESSATVELAAHALHTKPCRIAKTLSFMLGDSPILVVTAGNVKIDNAKYRHAFGSKGKNAYRRSGGRAYRSRCRRSMPFCRK